MRTRQYPGYAGSSADGAIERFVRSQDRSQPEREEAQRNSNGPTARRALGVLAESRAVVCHDRGRTGREYVELFGGNVVKRAHARLEVLGKNFLRDVRQPLCELRYST